MLPSKPEFSFIYLLSFIYCKWVNEREHPLVLSLKLTQTSIQVVGSNRGPPYDVTRAPPYRRTALGHVDGGSETGPPYRVLCYL